jgi:hypothetical protein
MCPGGVRCLKPSGSPKLPVRIDLRNSDRYDEIVFRQRRQKRHRSRRQLGQASPGDAGCRLKRKTAREGGNVIGGNQ